MGQIDDKELKRLADAMKIAVSADEEIVVLEGITEVLTYVDSWLLSNYGNTPALYQAIVNQNVFRDDECKNSMSREDLLRNAPMQDGICFLTPSALAGE